MTPARRRLVALAAALAPRRALDLLARLGDGREEAGGHPLLARLAREAGRPADPARPGIFSAGAARAGALTRDAARTEVRATDLPPGRRR